MNEFSKQGDPFEASFERRFFTLLTRIYRPFAPACRPQHARASFVSAAVVVSSAFAPCRRSPANKLFCRWGLVQSLQRHPDDRPVARRGLGLRVRNPDDRRSVLVELTDAGSQRLHEGQACLESMAKDLLEPLTLAERENIIVVFERVLALLESQATLLDDSNS